MQQIGLLVGAVSFFVCFFFCWGGAVLRGGYQRPFYGCLSQHCMVYMVGLAMM